MVTGQASEDTGPGPSWASMMSLSQKELGKTPRMDQTLVSNPLCYWNLIMSMMKYLKMGFKHFQLKYPEFNHSLNQQRGISYHARSKAMDLYSLQS